MQIRYSTFTAFDRPQSTLVDEPWLDFVARLLSPVVTANKTDVGLFAGAVFGRSGKREKSNVEEVSFFAMDFDNGYKDKATDTHVKIQYPIEIADVEMLLDGYEYVIATSHNHQLGWPKFRVIMPLAQPVTLATWHAFVSQVIVTLGLDELECLPERPGALDPCFRDVARQYYWPSHAPNSVHYSKHHTGNLLSFNQAVANIAQTKIASGTAKNFSPFTPDQISRYWEQEDPAVIQDPHTDEWRYNCAIHGGDSFKLYVNAQTGNWYCQSACHAGGDIYEYHKRKHKLSFPQARTAVHQMIGTPEASFTQEQLTEVIQNSEISQVDTIVKAIAQHPTKIKTQLKNQLITRHPELSKEDLTDALKSSSKVTQLFGAGHPAAELVPTVPDDYGLKLAKDRYSMEPEGVFQMTYGRGENASLIKMFPPVADRAIWPSAIGRDLKSEFTYLQLSWYGSKGRLHQEWLPEGILRDKAALCKLDDAPFSLNSINRASEFLTYAKTTMEDVPMSLVASSTGWYGVDPDDPHAQRFVIPGDPVVGYVGPRLSARGTIAGWSEGLHAILALGRNGYRSLAMVAFSAGSPLIQLVEKRSPVAGIIAESSTGKGKSIEFAVSIFTRAADLTVAASATAKGGEDKMLGRNGLPVFYDEIQQVFAKRGTLGVESILYDQANNKGRLISSQGRKTIGGEDRYHATLFAAESNVMHGLQGGAQNRAICLLGDTKPLGDERTVSIVERCTINNYGVVGPRICEIINEMPLNVLTELHYTAGSIYRTVTGLKGNDHYSIAMAIKGLELVEEVTGVPLPIADFQAWLIAEITNNRANAKTSAHSVLLELLEMLAGMRWGQGLGGNDTNLLQDDNGVIAFRGQYLSCAPNKVHETPLEINPTHPKIETFLKLREVKEVIAHEWVAQKWLSPSNRHTKHMRGVACTHAPGARCWRVTQDGLDLLGPTTFAAAPVAVVAGEVSEDGD